MSQQRLADVIMAVPACRSGLQSWYFCYDDLIWFSSSPVWRNSTVTVNTSIEIEKMGNVFNKQHLRFE